MQMLIAKAAAAPRGAAMPGAVCRWRLVASLGALALCLSAGAGTGELRLAGGGTPPTVFSSEPVNDEEVTRRLIAAGEDFLRTGRAVKSADLRRQLERPSCALALPRPSAARLELAAVAARCRAGVLVVAAFYKCKKCTKWHVNAASGVMLTPAGAFATSQHVVTQEDIETLLIMTGDGRIAPVREVLAANATNDVAILQAEGAGYVALPLVADAPVGSAICVLSHPDQHYYALTAGLISRYYVRHVHPAHVTAMAITADFGRGSSGAPVLNLSGGVVGLVESTASLYYHEEEGVKDNLQMVFKQCVPARAILALVRPAP